MAESMARENLTPEERADILERLARMRQELEALERDLGIAPTVYSDDDAVADAIARDAVERARPDLLCDDGQCGACWGCRQGAGR